MAAFSKKHYELSAKMMQATRKQVEKRALSAWYVHMTALADMFEHDNEQFDRIRFYNACMLGCDINSE